MVKLIYLDTNVFLDYRFDRTASYRPLGEIAHMILQRAVTCEFSLLVSDILLKELQKFIDDIQGFIEPITEKCVFIKAERSDYARARRSALHFPDSLHIVLAERYHADAFVTNDKGIRSDVVRVIPSSAL